ncbi:CLIP domain-containing serine protease B4-like [Topomyia yanbarensis]|uniref:CLIP domain-containing serine protease B4-like n=1 Tax=Topomyia yanbarensis TaxID=2498891 RepID=UPI00273C849C|nr:CLIP domain-containing serine protease B4-like [Topomyia yanbarensis]
MILKYRFSLAFVAFMCLKGCDFAPHEWCVDQNGYPGKCVRQSKCKALSQTFRPPIWSFRRGKYLGNHVCGGYGYTPLVCCVDHTDENELQNIQANLAESSSIVSSVMPPLENLVNEPQLTSLGEFPWSALIQYRKLHGFIGFHCGGTLIHERYVITAAHCIVAIPPIWKVSRVRLGEYDTKNGDVDCVNGLCADMPVDVDVDQVLVHQNYTPRQVSQYHDIALIQLAVSVRMTVFIQPIQLATGEMENMMMNGAPMAVMSAGWGRTKTGSASNVKLKVRLDINDFNACTEAYQHAGAQLQDTQMCASEWRGTGICSCDSGGPLMAQMSDRYYLVGIVSFGPANCGMKDVPGVYTNVMRYTDWIYSNIS